MRCLVTGATGFLGRHVVRALLDAGHEVTALVRESTLSLEREGAKLAIGTEGNFVRNAREQAQLRGVEVMHLADIPDPAFATAGCGCATMSRNDPPHLAGMLDLLRRGTPPAANKVLAGDSVDERTGALDRLDDAERAELVRDAKRALEAMIEVVEGQ